MKIKFCLMISFIVCFWVLLISEELNTSKTNEKNVIQCGNLIYSGTKSSVCFADRFLTRVSTETTLNPAKKFTSVKLGNDEIFDYPISVFSGEGTFSLTKEERANLRTYLYNGGFILSSPGCSDKEWDKSIRNELKIVFPELKFVKLNMDHPIFSTVHKIPTLHLKHGGSTSLEALEINGRIAFIYSKDGLNDVKHAKGCCCCGGDEIKECELMNVNIFTYALLY